MTMLYTLINVVIIFVAGVVTLHNGIVNHNWQTGGLREYIQNTFKNYTKMWDAILH